MAVSARNQLTGTVSAVAMGAVNDEVELTLAGGAKRWVWRKGKKRLP